MGEIRVISGLWRGRRIRTGKSVMPGLRPTADRVRTSLFDRLSPILPGARVLDLFAGTGALGIEALSRGASEVVFVEKAPAILKILDGNLALLEAANAAVLGDDVFRCLRSLHKVGLFDLVLADPPYEAGLAARLVQQLDRDPLLKRAGLCVIEHSRREVLPGVREGLEDVDTRRYGDTVLTFYRRRGHENGAVPGDV